VAVSHSAAGGLQEGSSSDLASVNYEARSFGLFNGMYTRRAMQLCPSLVILPYDFEAYHAVSLKLYEILAEEAIAGGGDLEAISCDEAMLWISLPSDAAATSLAERVRSKIRDHCRCNASIGIGSNKLIARLATKKAKPNGLFLVNEDRLEEFMGGQRVGDLPGIGHSLGSKLMGNGWDTCAELWPVPLESLQTHFGPKLGENIYQSCRGQDPHPPTQQAGQKSVGSEISWGVRFEAAGERDAFIADLVGEVMARQQAIGKVGQKLHVKMYARKAGAGEPHKRLGRGDCDVFNKTVSLGATRYTTDTILKEVIKVIESSLGVATVDIRGIGIFFSVLKDASEAEKEAFDWSALRERKPRQAEMGDAELCKFLLAHGVEPSVYKELPESVQKELLADLHTIDDQAPVQPVQWVPAKRPAKGTKASPRKDTASMSLTQFFGARKGGSVEAKKSKTEQADVIDLTSSAGIDAEFFSALPSYLQEEIMEDQRGKGGPGVRTEVSESGLPESEHQAIDITDNDDFDEAAILGHAKRLLAAENYEQLSRDLSRLQYRFPSEMEPVLAQVQGLFYRQEGASLFIP
jgi:nucleotidyltransferase/DNA polymerase involved in DNA repair